jgi:hypothetical protein
MLEKTLSIFVPNTELNNVKFLTFNTNSFFFLKNSAGYIEVDNFFFKFEILHGFNLNFFLKANNYKFSTNLFFFNFMQFPF